MFGPKSSPVYVQHLAAKGLGSHMVAARVGKVLEAIQRTDEPARSLWRVLPQDVDRAVVQRFGFGRRASVRVERLCQADHADRGTATVGSRLALANGEAFAEHGSGCGMLPSRNQDSREVTVERGHCGVARSERGTLDVTCGTVER